MEAIRRLFSPEFRNRLDAVVQFAGLDQDTIERVVDKLLVEAERSWNRSACPYRLMNRAQVDRQEGLRSKDGGEAHGARHPGVHQAALAEELLFASSSMADTWKSP